MLKTVALLKQTLTNKTIDEKLKAIKVLEKPMSNKQVGEKYNVPRETVLTWVKNKQRLLASLEKKSTNSKQQKLHSGDFEKVEKPVYT